MAITNALTSMLAQADNLAAYRHEILTAIDGRAPLWDMVDDAADQPYENSVKGQEITDLDTALDNLSIGANLSPWFSLHDQYYSKNLAPTVPTATTWAAAMAYYRCRVSGHIGVFYKNRYGSNLAAAVQFPVHYDLGQLGSIQYYGNVFTDGIALPSSSSDRLVGPGIVGVTTLGDLSSGSFIMTITLTYEDGTDKTFTGVTIPNLSSTGDTVLIGETDVTGAITAGVTDEIQVADSTPFKAGTTILVREGEVTEIFTVTDVTTGVLTVDVDTTNTNVALRTPRNSFTTAAKVYPLWIDCTACSATSGSNGYEAVIQFQPDRPIDLTDPG